MLKRPLALLAAAAVLAAGGALAQDEAPAISPADPGSVQAVAGDVILYFVGGRSRAEASSDAFNPFEIDGESLLFTLGAFFVTTTYDGEPVHEGELSIYPQFSTPFEAFEASSSTPAIIPFAVVKNGDCHAGYVAGHPVADTIYAVDLTGQICHAATVEELLYAQYAAATPATEPGPAPPTAAFDPANPTDADLDLAVWAAYNGAYALAVSDPDYLFIRDGNFDAVRNAVIAALEKEGLAGIQIDQVATPAEAFGCAPAATTLVRVAFVSGDAGLILVAASSNRISSYAYDPTTSDALDIDFARPCDTAGLGRAPTLNVP